METVLGSQGQERRGLAGERGGHGAGADGWSEWPGGAGGSLCREH